MFSTGLLLSAGATIVIATLDKACEELGIHWLGSVLRIAVPIAGLLLGVYFIETNILLRWLR
ncbi:hypothetical protein M3685_10555 [Heyndrickxia oleronia]|uniref:hypothetical protein n=1 Tax=Heyndrickxia oleronia TaxID=38875 RepID=UPI002040DD6E|nr:hypothetical protein [Heyndrickxia oleronia]MCM3454384.1 hypothetical protein [Heyndrickxia oleronia]